jgi:carboxyl-terminal processing protease
MYYKMRVRSTHRQDSSRAKFHSVLAYPWRVVASRISTAISCRLASAGRVRAWGVALFVSVATWFAIAPGLRAATGSDPVGVWWTVLQQIEKHYVLPVPRKQLVYGAIRGMVSTLDPHSSFLDPAEYQALKSDTEGKFAGIGVEIEAKDGWLIVNRVFEGGPAARAGLRPGDRFLTLQGRDARDIRLPDAVLLMRGPPGTKVEFSLRRGASLQALTFHLVREVIHVKAVDSRILPGRILYVQVRVFQEHTADEVRDAVRQAQKESEPSGGILGMVLDLRDNVGGLFAEAIALGDLFLERGVIVVTRGRGGRVLEQAMARKEGTIPPWPMVAMINSYSASAAEIVAGALQDHRRAVLLGTRSFGKGSVQSLVEMAEGSALKLTIARYYTPSGRSIQAEGIAPDMWIEQVSMRAKPTSARETTEKPVSEASLERHLTNDQERRPLRPGPSLPFPDDLQAHTAYQTVRALSLSGIRAMPRKLD